MSILCDWEIKALSLGDKLIEPFTDHVVRLAVEETQGTVFKFTILSIYLNYINF